ncbi:restriction endonuclease subunit S [Psychrobacter sp.]|uniref:restriction endonuclease subunit S n=1 Tax=Psychrobacter sp. TaxID=56811 RepID=UPI003561B15F
MASELFELRPLEELVAIHDADRKPVKKGDRKEGVYPYYGASGITDYVDDFIFDGDYVLLSEDGDNLRTRNTPIAFMARGKFWVNNHAHILKGKNGNNTDFICYALQVADVNSYISGSTRPKITQRDMKNIPVYCPPLKEQKAIAHILGSLDDKIELNRQMNETLEAMAQVLFKSWFVDFDPVIDNVLAAGNAIPDEFIERAEQREAIKKKDNSDIQSLFPDEFEFTEEMGWIPKGWAVKRIKDIGKVVTGKTPPKKIDNAYSEGGTPFITPTDIDDLPFVIYTNRYLSEDGVQAVKNSRISAGSICVTCIGSQMGKTTISPLASVSNQQINSITGCNQFWRNYLFFNLRRRRDEIFLLGSSGSTMPILNKSNFEAFPILCPSEKLLSSLDSNFQSTIDSILENTKQSYTLAKLRDTLLPKLMSGELRIPDAAALVDEVI